jgi:DNA-directed RNA polymerase subunit RPC12/RpoP
MQMDDDNFGEEYSPDLYKCPKCGTEMHFQPNTGWYESPVTQRDAPMCPNCWDDFLKSLGFEMTKVEKNG